MLKIATHDGSFHADETIACAILTYIYNAEIIRSRDPNLLETADIIIDVSGINDEKHFDHHSPLFNLSRANGINYATAGLMWLKYGKEFLKKIANDHFEGEQQLQVSKDDVIEGALERIDREVMYMVDLNDNGQLNTYIQEQINPQTEEEKAVMVEMNEFYRRTPDLSYLVATQNLPNVSGEEQNKNFLKTVQVLKQLLVNIAINALNTQSGIAKVLEAYQGGPLLIMQEKLPWTQAVLDNFDTFKDCYLAVYPDRKRGWRIQSLPYSTSERYKNKLTAPVAWRGLDDVELDKVTGLTNTIFVHRAGFTGGALEYDTILKMANLWLEQGHKVTN